MISKSHAGAYRRASAVLTDKRGQGTTEYAILVGVLVVIAVIAVVAFRGKLEELWTAISDGINGL
ncbi:MAG: class III signal peptide-containing protein [Coriobacteriales bacterium]|nr:class III signal peptide-containing protein [Coriobacteriales bacterium]